MNCLNCSKYLHKAIDSVYAQTYKDWEIIFWDNASTDNSPEIATSYDEKLRYFKGDKTEPLGKARNLAIEKSRGKFIAFLDCDDIWLPLKIEKQMKLFDKNPKLGLVYSDCLFVYPEGKNVLARKFFNYHRGHAFKEMLSNNFIVLSTTIVRKNVLNEFGGFPLYNIAEEFALFLKIAKRYQIDFVNEPLTQFLYHESNASRNLEINLKEVKEIYSYWLQQGDEEIKKICKISMAKLHYGLSRKALFHIKDKSLAKYYIKGSLQYQKKFKFYTFWGFCYLPMWSIQGIRKLVLKFI